MAQARMQIIRGGRILRADINSTEAADILIADGEILEVGPPGMEAPADAQTIDASDHLLHPGLINGHTHGYGHYSRGLTDDVTLELLLGAGGWFSGNRTHEDKYYSTAIGAAEMVLKGCTSCYDLFWEMPVVTPEGMQAAGKAYQDVGMRAVLAPMVADYPFFRAIPGLYDALPVELKTEVDRWTTPERTDLLKRLEETVRTWPFDPKKIAIALGPTIPLLCTDDFMKGCARLAREHGIVLQTHLSESKIQEVSALKRYGKSLTAHLADLGVLGPDLSAAHGVWLADEDMCRLADAGVSVVLNPGSNLRLGSGLPHMRRLLDLGVNVGIGTDSSSCSDNQNMYEAMRMAAYISHVYDPDYRNWVVSHEAAAAATEGSARALGFQHVGRLASGYRADIVFLDLRWIHWIPLRNAMHQFVQAEDSTAVRHVMIDGKWVVRDRKLLTFDLDRLKTEVDKATERLDGLNADNEALFRKMQPIVGAHCAGLACQHHHVHRFAGERRGA